MALRKGVNVDLVNPHGNVAAEDLRGMSLVRLPINTRQVNGEIDFHAAVSLYRPYILALHQNGIDAVLVITHQTWGEGQGFNFSEHSRYMRPHDWDRLFAGVVNMTARFLREIPVKPIIQVWNEQDSQDDRASVIIPPDQYGRLVQMMRRALPDYRLMTGGYCSGAGRSIQQLKDAGILNLVNFVAFHPYGQGAGGVNRIFGLMKDEVAMWRASVPAGKLVVSEFGLMTETDRPNNIVAMYLQGCLEEFSRAKLAGAIWYAYDERMDNCTGIRRKGQVVPLLRGMLNESGNADPDDPTEPLPDVNSVMVTFNATALNVRSEPTLKMGQTNIVGSLRSGQRVVFTGRCTTADNHLWVEVRLTNGREGWVSASVAPLKLS